MNTLAKIIGYVYMVAWLLSALGLVDMYVCVGVPGSCSAKPRASKPVITTSLFGGGAT